MELYLLWWCLCGWGIALIIQIFTSAMNDNYTLSAAELCIGIFIAPFFGPLLIWAFIILNLDNLSNIIIFSKKEKDD